MKVLVTGGCGFIGRNLIANLIAHGHMVRCLDLTSTGFIDELGIDFIAGDITNEAVVNEAVAGMDAVVHLACNAIPKTSNADPCYDVTTNLCGSIRLLDAAVENKIKRFVFISSGGTVYGVPEHTPIDEDHPTNPDCSYGITKLAFEKYLGMYSRGRGISTCALRISNPYGEYQRVKSAQGAVAVFCYKALQCDEIEIWGDGSVARDFIYIQDAVSAIERALMCPDVCGAINIGSGIATSLNELLDEIDRILGTRVRRAYLPKRTFDVPINCLDTRKAMKMLGWMPTTPLAQGLERTIDWIRTTAIK